MHDVAPANSATVRSRSSRRMLFAIRWLVGRWRDYVLAKRTERALARLDDPVLKDLGLSRGSIPHVANGTRRNGGESREEWIIPCRYY